MKPTPHFQSARGAQASYGAHTPVLRNEVVELLELRDGDVVLDGTVGAGGHAETLLRRASITLIGIDRDRNAIEAARTRLAPFGSHALLTVGNFRDAKALLQALGFTTVNKALLDLGISSDQLEASGRGFSFERDEPLLMTMEEGEELTAKELLNSWDEKALADAIFAYGEEHRARRIARAIIEARREKPLERTADLIEAIMRATPARAKHGRLHPATRTFQALRIAVNDELGSLREGLRTIFDVLYLRGRLAVISFHSLEDRIVKAYFAEVVEQQRATFIAKRPIRPSAEEVRQNPRARSAKLRVIEKIHAA